MKKYFTTLLLFFFAYSANLSAQNLQVLNSPEYGAPLLLMIVQDSLVDQISQSIQKAENDEKAGFVLINGTKTNPQIVRDSFNNFLNSRAKISKRFVYLIFVGDLDFFNRYDQFEDDFFANYHFLTSTELLPEERGITSSYLSEVNWSALVKELNRTYRWPVFIDELQSHYVTYNYKNNGRFGMGFGMGPLFFFPHNTDNYVPTAINANALIFERKLNERIYLNTSLNFAWRIPKPQDLIREKVMGQIDIFALLDENADPQEINIDLAVRGHVFLNLNVEARYYFNQKKNFQPYLGTGINFTGLLGFKGDIDTTIIIDPDSIDFANAFQNRGDFGGGIDRDSLATGFDPGIFGEFGIPLSLGFQQRLGDRWRLDVNTRYVFDPSNLFGKKQAGLDSFGVNVGLVYRFLGKRQLFYDYVHLRKKKL